MTTTTTSLKATKREGTGKGVARKLRQEGRVPAVLYGKGMDPVPLSVEAHEALHLFQAISVENTIVDLEVEGEKTPHPTLVREIQTHPFKPELIHIDFLRIQKGVAVDLEIPVELEGTPVGVKMHGGILDQLVHELPVRCIPSKIPERIVIDVTELDVGDSVHVSDLELPEGVEFTGEDDRIICHVVVRRAAALEEEGEEGEEGVEGMEGEAAEAGAAEGQEAGGEGEGEG
ncbi:MAG: 50S ribosomal protein L25/general stress protein Ctc [Gemmatimonadota bacterium]